uniref:Beta-Casp domain-containing protein n=1 Tax=Biomphalaria glabrata TaxID=6526 RepID=A0A2C9L1D1_BIOGL
MLDCGLDIKQILHYIPLLVVPGFQVSKAHTWSQGGDKRNRVPDDAAQELKECGGRLLVDGNPEFSIPETGIVDLSTLDAILISSYSCMLALPYITEYTGFKGTIYMTEPTFYIGSYAFKQKEKDIFGALTVSPASSGCCIGSCNWIINSKYEKICYIAGTSTLTTHPRPMDQSPLKNADVLIVSCLTQTPLSLPDPMIGEFCLNAAVTVKNGGNVLVPCYASGVTFDLFECLSGHLDQCGLAGVPMYFLSPVSDSTLAYSNIFAEWLSAGKQSKVFLPECPFPHADLLSKGRLKNFSSIHTGLSTDFVTPCILFAGHPSLRMGDIVHFIELWGNSPSNTIIFTEPDFPHLDALAPFLPIAMRVCYCPIDTSLNFSQANKLIRDLRPLHLVVSESYTHPPVLEPLRNDLTVDFDPSPLTYKQGEILSLPVKRQYEAVEMEPELANTLEPVEVKPGTAIAMITAALVAKDNKYVLKLLPNLHDVPKKRRADGSLLWRKPYIFGTPNLQEIVDSLKQNGFTSLRVEENDSGSIIHLVCIK